MNLDNFHSNTPPLWVNYILLGSAGVFNFLQGSMADNVYEWAFRLLSLISLLIVIYINFNKAKAIFKTRKKKP